MRGEDREVPLIYKTRQSVFTPNPPEIRTIEQGHRPTTLTTHNNKNGYPKFLQQKIKIISKGSGGRCKVN
jgi:hypothetical protein